MNREKLKDAFREYKSKAKVDFAIIRPDRLGDCQSCFWYAAGKKYGDNCHGIFVKHWMHGMNRDWGGKDIDDLDKVFIGHALTEEQAKIFYEVFGKYYNVTPEAYDEDKCFTLTEEVK